MATTPEGKVKTKVKKILDQYGALHFSPMGTGYGVSGVSDIICLYRGKFIAIECKADEKKLPTELQKRFLQRVVDWGGIGLLIHNKNIDLLEQTLDILGEE
jgi:Holliday junction resolvase